MVRTTLLLVLLLLCLGTTRHNGVPRIGGIEVVSSIVGATATSPHLATSFVMQPGLHYLAITYHSGGSTVMTNLVGSSHTSATWSLIQSNHNVAHYTSVWLGTTTANSSGVVSNICAGDTGGGITVVRCRGITNAGTILVQSKKATNTTANPTLTFDASPYQSKENLSIFSVVHANNGATSTPHIDWKAEELADGGGYNTPSTSNRIYVQRRFNDASVIITDATAVSWAGLAVEIRAQ